MKRFTVVELANALGVTRDAAYDLVNYLEARGHVERDGKKKNDPGVRGRGQSYFKVPDGKDLGLLMGQDMLTVLNAPETVETPEPQAQVAATAGRPATTPPRKTATIPPKMAKELHSQAQANHAEAERLRAAGNDPILTASAAVLDAAANILDAAVAANA